MNGLIKKFKVVQGIQLIDCLYKSNFRFMNKKHRELSLNTVDALSTLTPRMPRYDNISVGGIL